MTQLKYTNKIKVIHYYNKIKATDCYKQKCFRHYPHICLSKHYLKDRSFKTDTNRNNKKKMYILVQSLICQISTFDAAVSTFKGFCGACSLLVSYESFKFYRCSIGCSR